MHCVKTINIERDYGTTRFFLLASIVFFIVFCLSYVATSFYYSDFHRAQYLLVFLTVAFLLYPVHKFFHIVPFMIKRKQILYKMKRHYVFIPTIHAQLQEPVSKMLYSAALILPFVVLNSCFIVGAIFLPMYAHYFCILLALHCSICLIDLLFLKQILFAPRNAFIEETPKGYEILVPEA